MRMEEANSLRNFFYRIYNSSTEIWAQGKKKLGGILSLPQPLREPFSMIEIIEFSVFLILSIFRDELTLSYFGAGLQNVFLKNLLNQNKCPEHYYTSFWVGKK